MGGGGGGGSLRAPGPRNTPDWKSCEFVVKIFRQLAERNYERELDSKESY